MWLPGWQLLTAQARWYGDAQRTVNKAEVRALQDALHWLVSRPTGEVKRNVVIVLGDSSLTIDFCTQRA